MQTSGQNALDTVPSRSRVSPASKQRANKRVELTDALKFAGQSHRDGAEGGQSDDASAQFDFFPAA